MIDLRSTAGRVNVGLEIVREGIAAVGIVEVVGAVVINVVSLRDLTCSDDLL